VKQLFLISMAAVLFNTALTYAEDTDPGSVLFQRCAACHQADGQGIPGAFPPLKNNIANIAATDLGRIYLVSVINAGLTGPISVGDTTYTGVMPAQGSAFDDQEVSDLLNYSVQVLDAKQAASQWKPYTAKEVAGIKAALSQNSAAHSASLRKTLTETSPQLFK
jgi:mono/diheme cytochrome c family protein